MHHVTQSLYITHYNIPYTIDQQHKCAHTHIHKTLELLFINDSCVRIVIWDGALWFWNVIKTIMTDCVRTHSCMCVCVYLSSDVHYFCWTNTFKKIVEVPHLQDVAQPAAFTRHELRLLLHFAVLKEWIFEPWTRFFARFLHACRGLHAIGLVRPKRRQARYTTTSITSK